MPAEVLTDFPISRYETCLFPPFGKKIVFLSGYVITSYKGKWGAGSNNFNDWLRQDVEFVIGPKWKSIDPKEIVPRVTASTIWQYPLGPEPSFPGLEFQAYQGAELFGWGVDNCRTDIKDDKIRLTCTLSAVSVCTDCTEHPALPELDRTAPFTQAGIIRLNYNVTAVGSFGEGEGRINPWPVIGGGGGGTDLNPQVICMTKLTDKDTPVTASGNDPTYLPSLATDNDSNTRWAVDGVGSWIQVNLGTQKKICKVQIMWYKGSEGRKYNFVIDKSVDNNIYSQIYAGISDGSSSIETYTFAITDAKYIRITVNGNNENTYASIRELAVLGTGV